MTEPDDTRQLSVEQENAIDLLLEGKPDREVAEAVGVTRQTVCDWRNHHAAFVAELNSRRKDVWGGQVERLRALVGRAVEVLEADLDGEDPRLRQAAAVHVLRAVGLYGGLHGRKLAPTGPSNASGVRADWAHQAFMDELGVW